MELWSIKMVDYTLVLHKENISLQQHLEVKITFTGKTTFCLPPVKQSTTTDLITYTHTELTAALRFSLPLCLAGCRCLYLLLHFIFVLLLLLVTSRILEQEFNYSYATASNQHKAQLTFVCLLTCLLAG